MGRLRSVALYIAGFASLFVIWHVASTWIIPSVLFPPPWKVVLKAIGDHNLAALAANRRIKRLDRFDDTIRVFGAHAAQHDGDTFPRTHSAVPFQCIWTGRITAQPAPQCRCVAARFAPRPGECKPDQPRECD